MFGMLYAERVAHTLVLGMSYRSGSPLYGKLRSSSKIELIFPFASGPFICLQYVA